MPLERLTAELVEAISAEYPSLSNLNLSNNAIRSIDCDLSRLPGVSRLNLSLNQLSSLPPTLSRQLPRLEQLLLAHNCFSSLEKIKTNIQGNVQLESIDKYRSAVVARLPQLCVLDDVKITQQEKDDFKQKEKEVINPILSPPPIPLPAPRKIAPL
ncbi:hypothetical protein THRCLA_09967 [Thraustotheca clavata]|uniref:Uncharacterized protein n=1 Tax=Thraustotheca clavata TaxID=74557 RepID=A0A1V9YT96_9STRA|nr:hypothetical protein THRCLA_09967 [Thraustotheca clavata]